MDLDFGRLLTIGVIVIIVAIVSITVLGFFFIGPNDVNGSKCLVGKKHDDNKPLTWKFKKQTDLCEMSKCVDSMECSNGDKVSKEQFNKIYQSANQDQKKCLKEANQDGHGKDGLVGYEALYCVDDKD